MPTGLCQSRQRQHMAEMPVFDFEMWIDEPKCDNRNELALLVQYQKITTIELPAQPNSVQYSAIGIMSKENIQDVYVPEGIANSLNFLHIQLLPILKPFDVISTN